MITEYQLILTATFLNEADAFAWKTKIKNSMPTVKVGLPTPDAGPHLTLRSYMKDNSVPEAV